MDESQLQLQQEYGDPKPSGCSLQWFRKEQLNIRSLFLGKNKTQPPLSLLFLATVITIYQCYKNQVKLCLPIIAVSEAIYKVNPEILIREFPYVYFITKISTLFQYFTSTLLLFLSFFFLGIQPFTFSERAKH